VHWTKEHPEVTFTRHALLERIEQHLRTLILLALSALGDRLPADLREAATEESAEMVRPLSYSWLADLLQFSKWEAEAAEQAKLQAMYGRNS
jgi:hypothetical protein